MGGLEASEQLVGGKPRGEGRRRRSRGGGGGAVREEEEAVGQQEVSRQRRSGS